MLRRQAGDTLVEVALSMAILGAVIAVAYGLSNRAVRLGREAKERNEAAQLQQYQAEALRNIRDNHGWENPGSTGIKDRIIDTGRLLAPGEFTKTDPYGTGTNAVAPSHRFYIESTPAGKWAVSALGSTGVKTWNGLFAQCVTARQINADQLRFDVHIKWPRSGGGADNTSVLTVELGNTK